MNSSINFFLFDVPVFMLLLRLLSDNTCDVNLFIHSDDNEIDNDSNVDEDIFNVDDDNGDNDDNDNDNKYKDDNLDGYYKNMKK